MFILFKIDHISCNENSRDNTATRTWLASVVNYVLGAYKILYKRDGHMNFGGGSFDCNLEFIEPFLRFESDRRAISPLSQGLSFSKCI